MEGVQSDGFCWPLAPGERFEAPWAAVSYTHLDVYKRQAQHCQQRHREPPGKEIFLFEICQEIHLACFKKGRPAGSP